MCICVLSVVSLSAMSTQYTAATIKLVETKRKGKKKQRERNSGSFWPDVLPCLTKKDIPFFYY